MSFLVILLVLWVEKFSAWRLRIQQDGPWLAQLQRLQQGGLQQAPWLCLAILVLLPVLGGRGRTTGPTRRARGVTRANVNGTFGTKGSTDRCAFMHAVAARIEFPARRLVEGGAA